MNNEAGCQGTTELIISSSKGDQVPREEKCWRAPLGWEGPGGRSVSGNWRVLGAWLGRGEKVPQEEGREGSTGLASLIHATRGPGSVSSSRQQSAMADIGLTGGARLGSQDKLGGSAFQGVSVTPAENRRRGPDCSQLQHSKVPQTNQETKPGAKPQTAAHPKGSWTLSMLISGGSTPPFIYSNEPHK